MNLQALWNGKQFLMGRINEVWDSLWMSVVFPNVIFSGVFMHNSATLHVPQVGIFWWEYVPLGKPWPVVVMEETYLLLLAITFPSSTCGDGKKFPGPRVSTGWFLWHLDLVGAGPCSEQGWWPAMKLYKFLPSGVWVFLRDAAGSIENSTCWTYFCTQGSEHQNFPIDFGWKKSRLWSRESSFPQACNYPFCCCPSAWLVSN